MFYNRIMTVLAFNDNIYPSIRL